MVQTGKYWFFRRISVITLFAVYFLILVGGIVRSTGSGMGCPDWPKCFDRVVPPTDASQLPKDYKETYVNHRKEKNIKFAAYLSSFGMNKKANSILHDQSVLEETEFNVYKTWTEYLNRLVGATIGILIFVVLVSSVRFIRQDKKLFFLSLTTFLLVGFQGWIGSIVVSTNLMPWIITVHMVLALVIVLLLIQINFRIRKNELRSSGEAIGNKTWFKWLIIGSLLIVGIQIILGTQVREAIDAIAADLSYTMRGTWVGEAGTSFLVHRSFSIIVLGLLGSLTYVLLREKELSKHLKRIAKYIIGLVSIEIVSGVVMAYFGIPPFIQPIHLLLSTLLFGLLYYLLLLSNDKRNFALKY